MSTFATMEVREGAIAEQATDTLALLVTPSDLNSETLSPSVSALNKAFNGALLTLAAAEGFSAEVGQQFALHSLGNISAKRAVLIGLGELPEEGKAAVLQMAAAQSARDALSTHSKTLTLALAKADASSNDTLLLGAALGAYQFEQFKSAPSKPKAALEQITCLSTGGISSKTQSLVEAIYLARDLSNAPPNVATPQYLVEAAQNIADAHGLEIEIITGKALEDLGMNLLYAVGKGSINPPSLVRLSYTPKSEPQGHISFVGKGITFDTGGYSIKPWKSQLNMHLDMCGAAAVLGAAKVIGACGSTWKVDFFIATAENRVSDRAYTPTEIIKGYGGKTVEIINTDAEGRLALADALSYAIERKPDYLIDLATLTGSCLVALGEHTSAVLGTDQELMDHIIDAGDDAGEHFWQLPLNEKLRSKLKSHHADTMNCATGPFGGTITAALFLQLWVGDTKWAHLDIAGPAMSDGTHLSLPGGTGFAVATLVNVLAQLEKNEG